MLRLLSFVVIIVLMSGCTPKVTKVYFSADEGDYATLEAYIEEGFFNDANAAANGPYPGITLCKIISNGNRRLVEMILRQRSKSNSFNTFGQFSNRGFVVVVSQLGCAKSTRMYNHLKSDGFTDYSNAIISSAMDGAQVAIPWLVADMKEKGIDENKLDMSLEHAMRVHEFSTHAFESFLSGEIARENSGGWATPETDAKNSLKAIKVLLHLGAEPEPLHFLIDHTPRLQALLDKYRLDKEAKELAHRNLKNARKKKQRLARKEEAVQKKRCLQANDKVACQEYLKTSSNQADINEIKQKQEIMQKAQLRLAALRKKQACKLKEGKWLYSSKAYAKGLAQGKGVALHVNGQLRFEGTFNQGVRVTGLLSYNDAPMYDGPISAGKPDGMGICFHQGEPEECKYYKGKRVDVIYKQRLAMLEQRRMMDDKIKQMADLQKQQLDAMQEKIDSVKSRSASSSAQGGDDGATLGEAVVGAVIDKVVDKAVNKAADKAVDLLFDALF